VGVQCRLPASLLLAFHHSPARCSFSILKDWAEAPPLCECRCALLGRRFPTNTLTSHTRCFTDMWGEAGYFEKMARGWSKHAHGVSSATSGCCCYETSLWHALSMFHTVSRRCRGWGGENPLRSKLLEPRASWRELGCWARQGRHAALLFFAKGLRAHVDREVNSGFGLLLAPWPTIFLGLLRAASAWISTRRF
jgi:hypothetical protein